MCQKPNWFHAPIYFQGKHVHLLHIPSSGAAARPQSFSHYYIHEDPAHFPPLSTRELSSPMIKRKKPNCRCISPNFPQYLEDNALQPGIMTKKDLLCSCKCIYYSRPTTLTWQCVQRDNFRWRERWPLRMLKVCTRDRKQNLIWCFLWILSEWTSRVEEVDPRR